MEDNIAAILRPYRARIDALDDRLVDLLTERADIIREVAVLKAEKNIPAIIEDRINEVLERCVKRAKDRGNDGDYIHEIYKTIIHLSCEMEKELKTGKRKTG